MTKRFEMEPTDKDASLSDRCATELPDSSTNDVNKAGVSMDCSADPPVNAPAEEPGQTEQTSAYSQFKLKRDPICLSRFEIGPKDNNFFKGCKWSPDGACLMTCSNDKTIRLFNLPSNFSSLPPIDFKRPFQLNVDLQIKESGLVYDYCFNPNLNSSDSSSCL